MSDFVMGISEAFENHSELGKKTNYDQAYNPERLYPIPRDIKRKAMGINPDELPFVGFDCWNHYEVSWLNAKGKPMVGVAEIFYDCSSPYIVESKSLKLYFNSLNNTTFKSIADVIATIKKDLEDRIQSSVNIHLTQLNQVEVKSSTVQFKGECIDDLDIECHEYTVDPNFLKTQNKWVEESLYSDLLKSNCPVTHQPDWGSVQISYVGNQLNREGLLRYIVSYRNHNEFHEQCIERIFMDIMRHCHPEALTVYGRYTRRGGLDINPYRSTKKITNKIKNFRLYRQ